MPKPSTDRETPLLRLSWLDRQGEETPIPVEPLSLVHARVSPDGRRAALGIVEPHGAKSIALIELDTGIRTRVNPPLSYAGFPSWSRDGTHVAFHALLGPHFQLGMIGARPGAVPERLTSDAGTSHYADAFTPDGRILAEPFRFRLVQRGEDCVLIDPRDESRRVLADTRCVPE